jgi:hypothetical protein
MRDLPFPLVAPVRGVSFHQDVVCTAQIGQLAEIAADPANEYDPNACAVHIAGELAGHLPRELAARLRATGEQRWDAEVVEVLRGSKATGLRVRLRGPAACDGASNQIPLTLAAEKASPTEPVAPATPTVSETPEALDVLARSGRYLGRYVGRTVDGVKVMTCDNREVTYPAGLVEIRPSTSA